MAPDDLESQVVGIEVMAQDNPQAALDRARSLGDTSSDKRLNKIRWRLIGELSIQLRQPEPAREAVGALRQADENDVFARIIEVGVRELEGLSSEQVADELRAIVGYLPADFDGFTRTLFAPKLRKR